MALTKAQERQKQKQIEYWTKREEEATKRRITEEKAYERELQKIYDNMLDNIQKEIDAFYGKYAKQNGITLAEAKKAVSELDIKAYERKAKRYVRDKDFSAEANEEMRLYNLTMKINRLEMLKANIGLELISGHDELQKFMEGVLQGRTMEELERQAGILGKTVRNNAQTANAIVNASFHNAKFSDRIWMHQDLLKSDLNKLLQSGLIAGKNPRVLAREIKSRFGVKTADAERLMRTELARVQTEAQKQSFEANGFTQYIFLALGDACDICKDIDENHYNVKDMMPGLNAPPMHPFCRCSIAAYEDDDEYEAWLEHLSNGGTTESFSYFKEENKALLKIESGSTKSFKRSLEDIAAGKAGLTQRRKNILARMPKSGDSYVFGKDMITEKDLAYLSAATGNEFALFRSKKGDIVVRGDSRTCDVSGELAEEILKKRHKWVAHSHVDKGPLMPSAADRETLKKLGQKQSTIVGINGEVKTFGLSPFEY